MKLSPHVVWMLSGKEGSSQ